MLQKFLFLDVLKHFWNICFLAKPAHWLVYSKLHIKLLVSWWKKILYRSKHGQLYLFRLEKKGIKQNYVIKNKARGFQTYFVYDLVETLLCRITCASHWIVRKATGRDTVMVERQHTADTVVSLTRRDKVALVLSLSWGSVGRLFHTM